MMTKGICEVCGKVAANKKKVKPRFCSMKCRKIGYRHTEETLEKMRIGRLGKKFTPEQKERHLAAVRKSSSSERYRKNMSLAKTGVKQPYYSKVGAGPNNKNSKMWWFIKDGVHYRFKSLNRFVRENKHLFTEDELTEYKTESRPSPIYRATVMLRNLQLIKKNGEPAVPSCRWHGWTIGEKWEQGFYDD